MWHLPGLIFLESHKTTSDQTWYGNDNRLRLLLMTAASISRSTCGCLRPTWRFASGSSWAWMLPSRYPGASCRHPERRLGPRCLLHLWLRQHYPALWEKTRPPIFAFQTTYSISLSRDSARSSTWSPTAIAWTPQALCGWNQVSLQPAVKLTENHQWSEWI